jgi:shikimate kinase
MAAGKSTIGRRVARELDLPFVDTDATIVERYGPIPEIFAMFGDGGFRDKEFELVQSALEGPPAVLALGGGAVTHEPTRKLLAEKTVRVFIDVPLRTLLARLRRSRVARPVLGDRLESERVERLWKTREPLYREAEITVEATRGSQSALAREIATRVKAFTP